MRQFLMSPCFLFLVCGCSGAKSTPAWVEQLQAHESAERLRAAQALGERRAEATIVVPALTNALKDTDAFVRREAARAATFRIPCYSRTLKSYRSFIIVVQASSSFCSPITA